MNRDDLKLELEKILLDAVDMQKRLMPVDNNSILNLADTKLFSETFINYHQLISETQYFPRHIRHKIRRILQNINNPIRPPNWKDCTDLIESIQSSIYIIESYGSKIHREEFMLDVARETFSHKIRLLTEILSNFDRSVCLLRNRRENKNGFEINDEYDVQDLLHAILKPHFDDIEKEFQTEKKAGKSSRLDFLIKDIGVIVEVKFVSAKLREGVLSGQISEDIESYFSSTNYRRIYFLIYDKDRIIQNPSSFKEHEVNTRDRSVKVIISPKH